MDEKTITNTPRTGSLEDIQAAIEAENKAASQQIGLESALAVGATQPLGSIEFPPPTIGSLMLLDLIGSPFLTGGETIGMRDIIAALFILTQREQAAKTVFVSLRAERLYEGLKESASKSPELYAAHLQQIHRVASLGAAFDEDMAVYADSIGPINPAEIVIAIKDHLAASMGGFEMIPRGKDDPGSKKN